jgi:hypothetical protein
VNTRSVDHVMEPSEALSTAALVSATVAGFTGVVAVFGAGPLHEWPQVDRFRLKLLLSFSLLPLTLCMLGLLFLATAAAQPVVWRWSSGFAAALFLAAGSWNLAQFIRFPATELHNAAASKVVFYGGATLGFATCALQLYNLAALAKFWPFLAAIVVSVLGATLQFARLVLNRPSPR